MTSAPILIADDDQHIRDVIRFALHKAGFITLEADNGLEALRIFDEQKPQLVILDIMMPHLSGTDVCRTLRLRSTTPIIFLTSCDDEIDRILGLELGGDDYVTKPFSPRELVARVRAILRRAAAISGSIQTISDLPLRLPTPTTSADSLDPKSTRDGGSVAPVKHDLPKSGPMKPDLLKPGSLKHGPLMLDRERFEATWQLHVVPLTVMEFTILETLLRRPGKVFTREELISVAYDGETTISDRTVDSHIRRIRRKFNEVGRDPIETVHGLGYRLNEHG